uniref:Uncharacterized protein n=1 Tax=Sinocyclocheilus grahami TaxID=75366 RepID=A0A672K674_SINGR
MCGALGEALIYRNQRPRTGYLLNNALHSSLFFTKSCHTQQNAGNIRLETLLHLYLALSLTKPPISFIKHQLGVGPEAEDAESLRLELNSLQQKYDQLMEENKELRSRVRSYTHTTTALHSDSYKPCCDHMRVVFV